MSAPDRPTRVNRNAVLRARRGEADVAGHGEDRASARANAFDRGDDRLRAGAHRLDQVAGHARELQQPGVVHFRQRADDLVDVAARAEIAARAANARRLSPACVGQRAEGVAQLGIAFERQRVLPLRPVERDRRDAVRELPQEVLRRETSPGSKVTRLVPPSMVIAAPLMSRLSGRHSISDEVADRLRIDQPAARIHVGDCRARDRPRSAR